MNKVEWAIALFLVFIGFTCLTMSATWIVNPTLRSYLATLLQICLWAGGPVIVAGLIYLLVVNKKEDS